MVKANSASLIDTYGKQRWAQVAEVVNAGSVTKLWEYTVHLKLVEYGGQTLRALRVDDSFGLLLGS